MGYSVEDYYRMKHGHTWCPQPHRLMYFALAMGLVAGEVEAKKFGFDAKEEKAPRKGVQIQMPGGGIGFKPFEA